MYIIRSDFQSPMILKMGRISFIDPKSALAVKFENKWLLVTPVSRFVQLELVLVTLNFTYTYLRTVLKYPVKSWTPCHRLGRCFTLTRFPHFELSSFYCWKWNLTVSNQPKRTEFNKTPVLHILELKSFFFLRRGLIKLLILYKFIK